MSFGGPPVTTDTIEEADELMQIDEKASAIGMKKFIAADCFSHSPRPSLSVSREV